MLKRLPFILFKIFLFCLFLEIFLRLGVGGYLFIQNNHFGRYERKIEGTEDEKGCYSNCYTSNPNGYFPITIQAPTKAVFPDSILNLGETTPLYCLPYACQQRKDGFFLNRHNQVLLLGDSFGFGEGVKEEDSLGYLLGLKFSRYNFKNYSETAADLNRVYAITQQLFNNQLTVIPQEVIYFYNLDDVTMDTANIEKERSIVDIGNLPLSKQKSATIYPWTRVIKDSFTLHQEYNFLTVENLKDIYFNPINAEQVKRSMANLVLMDQLIKSKGSHLTVVIYPLMFKDVFGRYPFTSIHRFIKNFCVLNHIRCIDGYEVFKNFYSMNPFIVHPAHAHPNGLANRMMVDYLENQLDLK